jgi:hypothetical protein
VAACSNEGSPALPVSKTTTSTTTADSGASTTANTVAGSTSTSIGTTSTTTPAGPGLALTGTTGSGTLTWSVNPNREEFCYRITIKGVGSAKSAHLKDAKSGDVVLTLVAPGVDGSVNTCSPSDSITVEHLQQAPGDYAVDVIADKGTLKVVLK